MSNGRPSNILVLLGLGIKLSKGSLGIEIDTESVDLSTSNINTIQKIVRQNTHDYLFNQINLWKESNYNANNLEIFFKAVIPFYETIHNEMFDDSYTFQFKDIAFDTADLIFTLASIGFGAAGGYKGISAAIKAAKAGHSATRLAQTTTVLRNIISSIKSGSFLKKAGKELTDFVVPIFTLQDMSQAVVRTGANGASSLASKLRSAVRASDEATNLAITSNQFFQRATDEELLDQLYTKIYELRDGTVGRGITVQRIKNTINTKASTGVPNYVYRGQVYDPTMNGLKRAQGAVSPEDKDAYLVEIIKHTSNTGGSGGKTLSLSAERSVASRFACNRGHNARVFKIDTTHSSHLFRSVESIIKGEGPRLVREGKIRPATLSKAITQSLNGNESEIFYLGGDIPAEILEITSWRPVNEALDAPVAQANSDQLVQSMSSFEGKSSDSSSVSVNVIPADQRAMPLSI